MTRIILGPTISLNGSVDTTLDFLKQNKINCFQVFLTSPSQRSCICNIELKNSKTIKAFVHGKYIYNFCRQSIGAWKWQLDALITELNLSNQMNAPLIIHQGKNLSLLNMTNEQALLTYVENITKALRNSQGIILLENSAKQGTEMGYSLTELKKIIELVPKDVEHRVGICWDTCHAFAAGQFSMNTESNVKKMWSEIKKTIGINKLKLIHLNDSKNPFGSCKDRHENLTEGYIWNESDDGLKKLLKLARKRNIPIVTETPCPLLVGLQEIRDLKNKIKKRK